MITELNQLFESGLFAKLHKAGLMPSKISTYRDYYLYVDAQMRAKHINKTAAVKECAVFYQIDERAVWRAICAIS